MTRKIISVAAAAALCLGVVACGAEETNDTSETNGMLEVSSGPLTVRVPESWSEFDRSSDPESIKDPWVVGARQRGCDDGADPAEQGHGRGA